MLTFAHFSLLFIVGVDSRSLFLILQSLLLTYNTFNNSSSTFISAVGIWVVISPLICCFTLYNIYNDKFENSILERAIESKNLHKISLFSLPLSLYPLSGSHSLASSWYFCEPIRTLVCEDIAASEPLTLFLLRSLFLLPLFWNQLSSFYSGLCSINFRVDIFRPGNYSAEYGTVETDGFLRRNFVCLRNKKLFGISFRTILRRRTKLGVSFCKVYKWKQNFVFRSSYL